MNKLLVNEQRLLEKKTIEMLRLASVQFEKKEDRSMLILELYAITPDSVGPVSNHRTPWVSLKMGRPLTTEYNPLSSLRIWQQQSSS